MPKRKLNSAEAQAPVAQYEKNALERDIALRKLSELAISLNKVYNAFTSVDVGDDSLRITSANGKTLEICLPQTVSKYLMRKYTSVIVSIAQDVDNFDIYAKEMGVVFEVQARIPQIKEIIEKGGLMNCEVEVNRRGVKITPTSTEKSYYARIENGNLLFTINDRFSPIEISEIDEFTKKMMLLKDDIMKLLLEYRLPV